MTAKAAEIITDILVEAGIDHVFGMPGGATMFIFDALHDKRDQIRTVLARHEGGAACMADMYGRLTGNPDELKPALKAAINSDRPALIDVAMSKEAHFKLMI